MPLPKAADLTGEATRFLEANPDLEHFAMVFTDLPGVQRGKLLTREELLPAWKNGRYVPGSMLSVDVTGLDVVETGMVWDDGDADRLVWPAPGTLKRCPWTALPQGAYLGSFYELDGTPRLADPRNTLKRVLERFKAEKLNVVAAVELEFYLMDQEAALSGRPRPPLGLTTPHRPHQFQALLMQDIEDFAPFFKDLYAAAKVQALPVQALISEYSPGQMEIGLKHRTDALLACDEAIMFKRLVKGIAEKHGMIASFMAKPYKDYTGCGMHIHISLNDDDGNNLFAGPNPVENELLRYCIGGMQATMADGMAIFAPNGNSYRRIRKGSYAPIAPNWGVNNRTVSLRVPAGSGPSTHFEHRAAGADANPYLVMAAVLAGVHHGLTRELDPGEPVTGNGYLHAQRPMPTNWLDALRQFRASAILRDYLDPKFVDIFATIKEAEADRFFAEPQPIDFEYYLRNI